MSEISTTLPVAAVRLVGDPHPLCRQLSAPAGPSAVLGLEVAVPASVRDVPSLRGFLTWYRTELLVPVEMPAIRRAFEHACRYEVRELLELDRGLRTEARLRRFADASKAVGRAQLWRLLPMRDQRLVRRYRHALEAGQASGWHMLIYGVVLSVFSLPLRQGLLNYGRQTLAGFVNSSQQALRLPARDCADLLEGECATVRTAAERVLGPGRTPLSLCP